MGEERGRVRGRTNCAYSSKGAASIRSKNPKFLTSAAAPEYGFLAASDSKTSAITASHKSFRPKDDDSKGGPPAMGRNPEVDYHGERRSNETHRSTTDPEARLARKGNSVAAKLFSYAGHLLMENRSALIADMELSVATGYAERETALTLLRRLPKSARRRTVGGDKGYDTRDFVAGCREIGVTPHVAQNTSNRRSAIDGRTTRHAGHVTSLRIRKRIEGTLRLDEDRGRRTEAALHRPEAQPGMVPDTGAVYNLIRITALDAQAA